MSALNRFSTALRKVPFLCALLTSILIPSGFGAFTLSLDSPVAVSVRPFSSVVYDLDNDGDKDLITNGLFTLENLDGDASWGTPASLGDGRLEAIADFDGDDLPDILASVQLSPTSLNRLVFWLRNEGRGTGTFTPQTGFSNERSAVTLEPYDISGDGIPDVLWLDRNSDRLEWFLNDGQGTFTYGGSLVSSIPGVFRTHERLIDLTGDGIVDFVCQDGSNVVMFAGINTTPLSFSGTPTVLASDSNLIDIGAIGGTGDLDLMVYDSASGFPGWKAGDGTGGFGPTDIQNVFGFTRTESLVDLDMDGDDDLIGYDDDDGVFWSRNNNGTFAVPVILVPMDPDEYEGPGISAGLLNNDHRPDLVLSRDSGLYWIETNANANSFAPIEEITQAFGGISKFAVGDFNGDSLPDVAFTYEDGNVGRVLNFGPGDYAAPELIPLAGTTTSSLNAFPLAVAQIDGSEDDDLLILDYEADDVLLLPDSATGVGALQTLDTFSSFPISVAAGELSGDSRTDFAVAYEGSDQCVWYEQDASGGTFTRRSLTGSTPSVNVLTLADIDGDLDLDVVAGHNNGVTAFLNQGGGSFSNGSLIISQSDPTSGLQFVHLDADGDLDLMLLENSGVDSTVSTYFNDGSGSFTFGSTPFTGPGAAWHFAAGDLDNDNDADLVVTGFTAGDGQTVFENLGSGLFGSGESVATTANRQWSELILVDFDDDGDLDILLASRAKQRVDWIENELGETALQRWLKAFDRNLIDHPDSDEDKDGISLVLEFAFNLNPLLPSNQIVGTDGEAGLPYIYYTFGSQNRVRGNFIRRRDAAEIGLTYVVERSEAMTSWIEVVPGGWAILDDHYERVSFNRAVSGNPPKQFTRVRVEYNP